MQVAMGRGYGRFDVDWQAVSASMDCKGNRRLSFVYNNLKIGRDGVLYSESRGANFKLVCHYSGLTLNQYGVASP